MSDQFSVPAGDDMQRENHAFLLNVKSLVDFDYAELAPGHVLRRATDMEIEEIKSSVTNLSIYSIPAFRAWENRHLEDQYAEQLPREQWRYYVVAFQGHNVIMNELLQAFNLSWAEPEIGSIAMLPPTSTLYNDWQLFQSIQEAAFHTIRFVDLSQDDIAEIKQIWQLLRNHDNELIDMEFIAQQLRQLKALPLYSTLRFLGYFTILESLLTHPPQQTDPYDSITRQVKKKLTLLNHRFSRKLDYTPFGGAAAETIWGKLYKYRSLIAHGGRPHFEGELATLGSHKQALALLRHATKSVARQALYEPRLLADLRNC